MWVIHVIAGLWRHGGGPADSVPKLCQHLTAGACKVTLLTLDGPHSDAALACSDFGVDLRSFPVIGHFGAWYSPELGRALREFVRDADVIHAHGMWSHPSWAATKWARAYRKPLVLSPRGLLTPGMLRRSHVKKTVAWSLLDRRSVKYAAVIHALSETERNQMRCRTGGKAVSIIPNGVDLWECPAKASFTSRFPPVRGKKILLFLARVHPIKGVFDLLQAWKTLSKIFPQWHLLIVGQVQAGCETKIPFLLREYDVQATVTLTGPQYGQERVEAYGAADAFVLPSYAEGFSMSLLEAMACGLPVVYTDACNFPEAARRGAGLVGSPGVKSLVHNLTLLLGMSDAERHLMGETGRTMVKTQYTWPRVASQWLEVYRWLTGVSPRPACVWEGNGPILPR